MSEKNMTPEMLTAADLQKFGFTRSMAYALLNRADIPVITIGSRKFIRREKFMEWIETQERTGQTADNVKDVPPAEDEAEQLTLTDSNQ